MCRSLLLLTLLPSIILMVVTMGCSGSNTEYEKLSPQDTTLGSSTPNGRISHNVTDYSKRSMTGAQTEATETSNLSLSPTATATVEPIATATVEPTATATVEPTATAMNTVNTKNPTPIPTLQPVTIPQPTANLVPFTPEAWSQPLVVNSAQGLRVSTLLSSDGPIYINWSAGNIAKTGITQRFFIDLYMDHILVERWSVNGLEGNSQVTVTDWDRHIGVVKFSAGTHLLKLVVDSTDLVLEADETDNEFQQEFNWSESILPAQTSISTRLPDLVPYAPSGWSHPLVVTPFSGSTISAPLSLSVPTYIRYGVENQGLSSVDSRIWVHLFLDETLIEAVYWNSGIVDNPLVRPEWNGLYDTIRMTPGEHWLKIVVDPANLVLESDENNNVYQAKFHWDFEQVTWKQPQLSDPVEVRPVPLILPNLVPGWKFGWDGPIIVSKNKKTYLDAHIQVGDTPFVDIVVRNQSPVGIEGGFSVDLYLDEIKIGDLQFEGVVNPNSLIWTEDWEILTQEIQIEEGAHVLRLVIDPENLVVEANEDDNIYEKILEWSSADSTFPGPITYTDSQLHKKISNLRPLVDAKNIVIGPEGKSYASEVLDIVEVGYYLLTGKSLKDERVGVWLLSRDDYLDWIDESFTERFDRSNGVDYDALILERELLKERAMGFKTRRFGKTAVVVDGGNEVAHVITTLAHELGHLQQDILAPSQTDYPGFYIKAIHEAQAQQFERAFWLSLEEFTGTSLMSFPDMKDFRSLINGKFSKMITGAAYDQHSVGYLLQWIAVLDDPQLVVLKTELETFGHLSKTSSLYLFEYLTELDPGLTDQYVKEKLDSLDDYISVILDISHGRLISNLDPDIEGSSALREASLLSP